MVQIGCYNRMMIMMHHNRIVRILFFSYKEIKEI